MSCKKRRKKEKSSQINAIKGSYEGINIVTPGSRTCSTDASTLFPEELFFRNKFGLWFRFFQVTN